MLTHWRKQAFQVIQFKWGYTGIRGFRSLSATLSLSRLLIIYLVNLEDSICNCLYT